MALTKEDIDILESRMMDEFRGLSYLLRGIQMKGNHPKELKFLEETVIPMSRDFFELQRQIIDHEKQKVLGTAKWQTIR